MRVRAHPKLHAARGIFARQLRGIERSAPGDQPGELRLHVRKQMMPHRRPDSVSADQCQRQILLARHAAAMDHGQSLGMASNVFELAAEPQFDIVMFVDLRVQRGLQIGAMHHPIRRAGAASGDFPELQARHFSAAAHAHQADGLGRDGAPCEPGLQSQRDQHAAGVGRELKASADFVETLGFLQNDDAKSSCRERERGGQSPDSGTSNEDGARSGHATARSGGLVLDHAFRRPGLASFQVGGETIKRRAIGADDLVVIAEIEKDMRVIERRIGAHAHELLRADLNDRYAGFVVKVRNDMVGHYIHLASQ